MSTGGYELSPDVASFAARARFAEHKWDVDTTVLSNRGGETRFYVRPDPHGWYVVTTADRSDPEQFELAAADRNVLDRYFLMLFGQFARGNRGLPLVNLPQEIENLHEGYSITSQGNDMQLLVDSAGKKVAVAETGIIGTSILVELSHLLTHTVDGVKAMFDQDDLRE